MVIDARRARLNRQRNPIYHHVLLYTLSRIVHRLHIGNPMVVQLDQSYLWLSFAVIRSQLLVHRCHRNGEARDLE